MSDDTQPNPYAQFLQKPVEPAPQEAGANPYAQYAQKPAGTNPYAQYAAQPAAGQAEQAPVRPRGAIAEILNQGKAGILSDLPKMAGQALQYTSDPGNQVYDWGKSIADYGRKQGERADLKPQEDTHNFVTNALASGARMIPQSIVPAAIATAAIARPTQALPMAARLAMGAVAGAAPAGMSQGQETLDKGLEKGIDPQEALKAARINALIEGGGETLGTIGLGGILGLAGRTLGKVAGHGAERALAEATTTQILKPWAREIPKAMAVEVGTEMGQNAGEAEVERRFGIDKQTPWDAAKEAIGPTVGMTLLLAPFGIGGHAVRAKQQEQKNTTFMAPDADPLERQKVAAEVATQIESVDKDAARNFRANTARAIAAKEALPIDATLFADPATLQPGARPNDPPPPPGGNPPPPGQPGLSDADHPGAGTEIAPENPMTAAAAAGGAPHRQQWAFRTQDLAQKQANALAQIDGIPYEVQPHPTQQGKFIAVPVPPAAPAETGAADPLSEAAGVADPAAAAPAPAAPVGLQSGEHVQVTLNGVDLFPNGTHVVGMSPDGQFAMVEGSDSAVPVSSITRIDPALKATIDAAGHEAATSDQNDRKPPSEAQMAAGNYKKGPARLHGLDLMIENPPGTVREGIDPDGVVWSTQMKDHYGYISGTKGADGQQVDTYIGPNPASHHVFIVDQINQDTGEFDEHKVMMGYNSPEQARQAYEAHYTQGWQGGENITATTVDGLKKWIKEGDTTRPYNPAYFPQATSREVPAAPAAPAPATTLTGILQGATRQVGIKGMEGQHVADPIAQDLLKSPTLPHLERALNDIGVQPTGVIGAGASSIVLDAGDRVVRLGLGQNVAIPKIDGMIQPIAAGQVDGLRYQIMPKADTQGITEADVDLLHQQLGSQGYEFTDAGTDNVGRINGKPVVIDPGAIRKAPAGQPANPDYQGDLHQRVLKALQPDQFGGTLTPERLGGILGDPDKPGSSIGTARAREALDTLVKSGHVARRGHSYTLADAVPQHERPLADKGLTSYRYKGPFGYVMIGANDHEHALREANRSLEKPGTPDNLEVWDGERYVAIDRTPAGTTTSAPAQPAQQAQPATPAQPSPAERWTNASPDERRAILTDAGREDVAELLMYDEWEDLPPVPQKAIIAHAQKSAGTTTPAPAAPAKGEKGEQQPKADPIPEDINAVFRVGSADGIHGPLEEKLVRALMAWGYDAKNMPRNMFGRPADTLPHGERTLQAGSKTKIQMIVWTVKAPNGKWGVGISNYAPNMGSTHGVSTLSPQFDSREEAAAYGMQRWREELADTKKRHPELAGYIDMSFGKMEKELATMLRDGGVVPKAEGKTEPAAPAEDAKAQRVAAALPEALDALRELRELSDKNKREAAGKPDLPPHEQTRMAFRQAVDRGNYKGVPAAQIDLDKESNLSLMQKHKDKVAMLGHLLNAKGGKDLKKKAADIMRLHELRKELAGQTEASLMKRKAPELKDLAQRVGVYANGTKGDNAAGIIKWRDQLQAKFDDKVQDLKHRAAVLTAIRQGKPVPQNVMADYPNIGVFAYERGSKEYEAAVDRLSRAYVEPPFDSVPQVIQSLRDEAYQMIDPDERTLTNDIADAAEKLLNKLMSLNANAAKAREETEARAWQTTPFAERIQSVLNQLRAAGESGLAASIENGMHNEASRGKLTEDMVAFREKLARDRLGAPTSPAQAQQQVHTYDPAEAKPLILIACGDKKLDGSHRAIDLYEGGLFQMLHKWLPEGKAEVYVMSARHGLVHGDTVLSSYDQKLTDARLEELLAKGVNVDDFKGKNFSEVYIAGSSLYRPLGEAYANQLRAAGFVGPDAKVDGVKGFIGVQRGQFGEYLRSLAGAQQPAAKGTPSAKTTPSARTSPKDRTRQNDPFLALLAEHGVAIRLQSDLGLEKGNKGNRMVPGYGPVLRHNGLDLDLLAEHARDAGFLTQQDIDDPNDNGGARKIGDLIRRAIVQREVIPTLNDIEDDAQRRAETREDAQLRAQADAMGIAHAHLSTDEVYDAVRERLADNIGLPVEVYDEVHKDADALQKDITDEQIDRGLDAAFAQEPQPQALTDEQLDEVFRVPAQYARVRPAQDDDAGTPRAGAETAEGKASPEAAESAAEVDGFALAGQTVDEGRAALAAEEARKEAEAKAEREAARRAEADKDRGSFTLTGSDRPADVLAAQGQTSIFDLPAAPAELDTKGTLPGDLSPAEKARLKNPDTWTGGLPEGPARDLAIFNNVLGKNNSTLPAKLSLQALKEHAKTAQEKGGVGAWHFFDMVQRRIVAADPQDAKKFKAEVSKRLDQADAPAQQGVVAPDDRMSPGPVTPLALPARLPSSTLVDKAIEHVGGDATFRKLAQAHLNDLAQSGYALPQDELAHELDLLADDLLWAPHGEQPAKFKEINDDDYPPLPGREDARIGDPGMETLKHLFPQPGPLVNAAKQAAGERLTATEAAARLATWKAEAKKIGETGKNARKVILSLFDSSGVWSQPYVDAGYTVLRYDLNHGDNLVERFPMHDLTTLRAAGYEIAGVIAQPPCTSFSNAGRWSWPSQHDTPSKYFVEKKYGAWASKYFDTAIDVADTLGMVAQAVIEFAAPTEFYVLENPRGRIAERLQLPDARMVIQPHVYGNAYTKETFLYGEFNTDLPTANVSPKPEDGGEGSRIYNLRGTNAEEHAARSLTPEGFAYAWFMANHDRAAVAPRAEPTAKADQKDSDKRLRALRNRIDDALHGDRQLVFQADRDAAKRGTELDHMYGAYVGRFKDQFRQALERLAADLPAGDVALMKERIAQPGYLERAASAFADYARANNSGQHMLWGHAEKNQGLIEAARALPVDEFVTEAKQVLGIDASKTRQHPLLGKHIEPLFDGDKLDLPDSYYMGLREHLLGLAASTPAKEATPERKLVGWDYVADLPGEIAALEKARDLLAADIESTKVPKGMTFELSGDKNVLKLDNVVVGRQPKSWGKELDRQVLVAKLQRELASARAHLDAHPEAAAPGYVPPGVAQYQTLARQVETKAAAPQAPAKPAEPPKLRGRDGKLTADLESVFQGHIDDGMTQLVEKDGGVTLSFPNDTLMGMHITDPKMVAFVRKAVAEKRGEDARDARQPAWNALGERVDALLPQKPGTRAPSDEAYQKVASALGISVADARAAHAVHRFEDAAIPAHDAPAMQVKGATAQGGQDALFSRTPSKYAREKVSLDQWRVLKRDHTNLNAEEQVAFDNFLKERQDGKRVLAQLNLHKGTPWARQALEGIFVRQAILTYIRGETPAFQSMMEHPSAESLRATLGRHGYEGLMLRLEETGYVGEAEKPVNNVSSSFINCNPSDDCAKYCYATGGHYTRTFAVIKAELVTLAVEHNPVEAAKRTARDYMRTWEFENNKALRLFDKGDGNSAWLPYIQQLNKEGVRVQIFSKNPEFLRQVPDMNLRLLSIDQSNLGLADANPDLPVAFVYDKSPGQLEFVAKLALRQQLAVVLPIQQGKRVLSKAELRELQTIPDVARHICPVDAGIRPLGTNSAADSKAWNCTKCDVKGGIGCFFGAVTKAVKAAALRPADMTPQQVIAERIQQLTRELNEITQTTIAAPGSGGNLAAAGPDAATRLQGLRRAIDGLMGELLGHYTTGDAAADVAERGGGNERPDRGLEAQPGAAGRTIPIAKARDQDGNPLASRATPLPSGFPLPALQGLVSKITTSWANAPAGGVHAVDSVSDLPPSLLARIPTDALRDLRGLYDPDTNSAYLVADRLGSTAEAEFVLGHEVLGHAGLRAIMDKATLDTELNRLRMMNPALAAAAREQAARFKLDLTTATEEALADWQGEGRTINGWQRFAAKVQAALRAIGLHSVADWMEGKTQAETLSLLAQARSAITGEKPVGIFGGEQALRYSSDRAPRWQSALADQIGKMPTKTAPAAQWLNALNGLQAKGVKRDEIEWSGLKEWLQLQDGKVTKDQVLNFLAEGGVKVDEVLLGEPDPQLEARQAERERMKEEYVQKAIDEAREEHEKRIEADVDDRMENVYGFHFVNETEDEDGNTVWEVRHEYDDHWNETYDTEEEAQARADEGNDIEISEAEKNIRNELEKEFDEDEARYYAEREFDNEHDEDLSDEATKTKFENWRTVPGGDPATYRELLITLDDIPAGQLMRRKAVYDKYQPEVDALRKELDEAWEAGKTTQIQEVQRRLDKVDDQRVLEAKAAAGETDGFGGDHWQQGQVLAHVRFDIRANPAGESVLQVHEIQSDWAEQGRSKGFHDDQARAVLDAYAALEAAGGKKTLTARTGALAKAYEDRTGLPAISAQYEATPEFDDSAEGREWNRLFQIMMAPQLAKDNVTGLAPAPFVKKTEAWVSLALKRVMTYAAEKGIDHVALPTGEQANTAFSLEKQVVIEYRHKPDGKVWMHVTKADNGNTITERTVEPKELPGLVGKEVADKMMRKEGEEKYDPEGKKIKERGEPTGVSRGPDTHYGESWQIHFADGQQLGIFPNKASAERTAENIRDMVREETSRVLAGDDLKIGGEPMRKYYDGMVVNIANDLLKKFGGGRVQAMRLGREGALIKPVIEEFKGQFVVKNELTGKYFANDAEDPVWVDEPNRAMGAYRMGTAEAWVDNLMAHAPLDQPGFTMTDALRERASQGLPLFSRPEPTDGSTREKAAPGANVQRLASLLGPQLYGDMADMGPVTVKELYQNAFDALKGSIESGKVEHGQIDIFTDRDTRAITVRDNGNGMTPAIINKAFLTIAGTSKETTRSSGGFGIAKMLFLFGNKNLSLVTVRDGVEARLETTGEQLMAAFTDPQAAPEIVTRPTNEPNGTTVTVTVPKFYSNPSTGKEELIQFPADRWDIGDTLTKSPLFENITVRLNGQEMDTGARFPKDNFTTFATVKFDWGTARIIVSKQEEKGWGANFHVLSNGLWQFGQSLKENPFGFGGENVPRTFYINVEPRVKPEEPGYPFALNRKGFSPAVADDFGKIQKYLSLLYGANKAAEVSAGFGAIEYVDADGKVSEPMQLAPKVDDSARENMLVINEGDKIEVHDGRMTVNGREVPELTPSKLSEVKIDISKFKIDQNQVDPSRPMIHDNVDIKEAPAARLALAEAQADMDRKRAVKEATEKAYYAAMDELDRLPMVDSPARDEVRTRLTAVRLAYEAAQSAYWDAQDQMHGFKNDYNKALETAPTVPVTQAMREQFGPRFDRFLGDIGRQFMRLRDALVENDKQYARMAEVPVGVSFDEEYYGVHTMVPFRGMFINPAMTAVDDADAVGPQASTKAIAYAMVGTMIHEMAHFREMNHNENFIGEMQRVHVVLDSADNFNLAGLKQEIRSILDRNHDIYSALNRAFRSDAVVNRGVKLKDGSSYSARDKGAADPVERAGRAGTDGQRLEPRAVDGNGAAAGRIRYSRVGEQARPAGVLSRASWTPERLDRLLSQYAYTNDGAKTKAYAAWISPADYLALTTNDVQRIAANARPLDRAALAAQNQEIFLQVDNLPYGGRDVTGHEGRHRVYALMQAGVTQIPVTVYSSVGAHLAPLDELVLDGQDFGHARAPGRGIVLGGVTPISYDNRRLLEQRFGGVDSGLRFSREGHIPEPTDPGSRRMIRANPAQMAASVGRSVKSMTWTRSTRKLSDMRSLGLQFLGRLQLTDVYGKLFPSKVGPENLMQVYSDLVATMDAEKTEGGTEADKIVKRWGALKDKDELADLMHDSTRLEIDASNATFQTGDNYDDFKDLTERFRKLSDGAKAVYVDAARMYDRHWEAVRKAVHERIMRSLPDHPNRANMVAQLEGEFFSKKVKGVYFPLARFGDYVITVRFTGRNPRPGQDIVTQAVARAETLHEAETRRAELLKAYPPEQGYEVLPVIKAKEYNAERDSVGRGFLKKLFGVLDEAHVDPSLQDSLNQIILLSMPDLSFAKKGLHRKGVPGFSDDARRAFAHHMQHGASYLAKLNYSDRLVETLDAMQRHVDERAPDPGYQQVKAQQVVDEMVKRHDAYMNPVASPWSAKLTGAGFLFYLGLSPASAMVNLMQTPTVAFPLLGGKFGYWKASRELAKASKLVMKGWNKLENQITGDEKKAYDEWVRTGQIDLTMAHNLTNVATGRDTVWKGHFRDYMEKAAWMFHHAELFNRQATLLAAYRLARKDNMSHQDAYRLSVEMNNNSHFNYAASNRPRFMQGPIAQVVWLFKQYAQNLMYTFGRNAYQAFRGNSDEMKQARKTLSGLLVTHAMAAGILGLPAVTTILGIASMLGSDPDDPWDAEVALRRMLADVFGEMFGDEAGEEWGRVLSHGLSRSSYSPWDISGRVGADHLIVPDVQESLHGADAFNAYFAGLLGPVVGMGANVAKGGSMVLRGDVGRGIETMLPAFMKGPFKAMRYATEGGAKDRNGITIVDDITEAEYAGQVLGFSVSRVREKQEVKSAEYEQDQALQHRRQALLNDFAQAVIHEDDGDREQALEKIRAYNEKHPNRAIMPLHLMQSVRNRKMHQMRAKDGLYLPPKRGLDVRQYGDFANAGGED